MSKVVPLHQVDALVMPLADGASLRVTRFLETPRVAVSLYGPEGGDVGGVILQTERARLLASWLLRMADESDAGWIGPTPRRSAGS
jgi:hypothetical protein